MKIKDSAEQITLDLFQNCETPEELKLVNLKYLATNGFILFAVIMQEKIFEDVRESPVEWGACEVEATKSIKHISKNIPKSSKIHYYTHRAHVLIVDIEHETAL